MLFRGEEAKAPWRRFETTEHGRKKENNHMHVLECFQHTSFLGHAPVSVQSQALCTHPEPVAAWAFLTHNEVNLLHMMNINHWSL